MFFFTLIACMKQADNPTPAQDTAMQKEQLYLDLDSEKDNIMAFIKTRGSLNPEDEIVYYWDGFIYNSKFADPESTPVTSYYSDPILRFEGFNIARFEQVSDTEYQMLTREITVYKNLQGKIIDCWSNARIGVSPSEAVPVVHVQNDPVNFYLGAGGYREMGDMIAWNMEVLLSYPSPLDFDEHREFSAGRTYQSVELFDFFSNRSDLENPDLDTVPVYISWSRVGQYLPWMKAGQKDGFLIYHAQGYKVPEGFDGLPEDLKDWTLANAPEYQHPPESAINGSNMTSWRYMDKILTEGTYPVECE